MTNVIRNEVTYRIDYAYETISEINSDGEAYEFLCSFYEIGATKKNRESTIVKKIEAWENQRIHIADSEDWG